MDETGDSVQEGPSAGGNPDGFYRLEANHSSASVFEDVEMAHDEVGRHQSRGCV